MKKEAKFNKIFWAGLVPLSVIIFLFVMLVIGIIYGLRKDDVVRVGSENERPSTHVCPKADPEKVYVHDTLYLKTRCNKEHVVETKTVTPSSSESPKDTGDSEK